MTASRGLALQMRVLSSTSEWQHRSQNQGGPLRSSMHTTLRLIHTVSDIVLCIELILRNTFRQRVTYDAFRARTSFRARISQYDLNVNGVFVVEKGGQKPPVIESILIDVRHWIALQTERRQFNRDPDLHDLFCS